MTTAFPKSRIVVTASLALVWAALLLTSAPIAAQGTPTPTVVADCSGIEAYIDALRQIGDDYREAFAEQLPKAPREWEHPLGESGDLLSVMIWPTWLTSASPEELTILADLWAAYAEALRAIEPPAIAQAFHDEAVTNTQSFADGYRDEGSMIALAVMLLGGLGGDPTTYNLGLSEESARLAESCPVWKAYLTELFSLATPVVSS